MAIWRLAEVEPSVHPTVWVHPSAQVIGDVVLEEGVSIWPGAVLRGDHGQITIGSGSNVQDGAVLHTGGGQPLRIGASCVIGHLAHLESAVVEDLVLVGSAAVVLPGAVLRTGSMIAAGALVTPRTEVRTGQRAQGVPARPVQAPSTLQGETRALAQQYRVNAQRFREDCVEVSRQRDTAEALVDAPSDFRHRQPQPDQGATA